MMGPKKAGKTSIHSVLFSSMPVKEIQRIGYTTKIDQLNVKLLNHKFTINDCGGQDEYFKYYLEEIPHVLFNGVSFLIYVFDVTSKGKRLQQDLQVYN